MKDFEDIEEFGETLVIVRLPKVMRSFWFKVRKLAIINSRKISLRSLVTGEFTSQWIPVGFQS